MLHLIRFQMLETLCFLLLSGGSFNHAGEMDTGISWISHVGDADAAQ